MSAAEERRVLLRASINAIPDRFLDAMDAAIAAERWAREHEGEVAVQMEAIRRDRPSGGYMVLLAAALRLVVEQRRVT